MEFGVLSLIPPGLAIILALTTRKVIPALFAGIWLGATMLYGWNPFRGLYATFEDFIIPSVADEWSVTVLVYCGLFGVIIAFLQRTGGAQALARAISRKVRTPAGAQGSTWLFGIIIFFEDYFNALTVGSVMRAVNDRMRVAREKLAYIVDSTAAPICLLAPVSTWVVYVMGLIGAQNEELDITGSEYVMYLATIPFNFYAILALALVGIVALTRVEFGPMVTAEHRARTTGKLLRDDAQPPSGQDITELEPSEENDPRVRNMIVPLVVLLGMIPPMFLWTGGFPENDLITAVGESNGALSILIAAFSAAIVALAMGVGQKLFTFRESIDIIVRGIKGMTMVFIILPLAWAIGNVTSEVGTADYVVELAEAAAAPAIIPVLIFLVGAFVSFTTGTSYGTFAIMIPIAMPLGVAMDIPMALVIAAVFSGGIFGDHCSPISDTTILASTGASCDHIDHVNTQLPYAGAAAAGAAVAFIAAGLTGSMAVGLVAAVAALLLVVAALHNFWGPGRTPAAESLAEPEVQTTQE